MQRFEKKMSVGDFEIVNINSSTIPSQPVNDTINDSTTPFIPLGPDTKPSVAPLKSNAPKLKPATETTPTQTHSFPKKKYRILALDGGGVRSLIEARILTRIAKEYPNFLSQIDLITGTSAGSIVGMAIANGVTPEKVSDWFESEMPAIFTETYSKRIWSLGNTIAAQYDASHLKKVVLEQIGTKKLSDITTCRVLVPTFNLNPLETSLTQTPQVPERKEVENSSTNETSQTTPEEAKTQPEVIQASKNLLEKRWKPEFLHNFPGSDCGETLIVDAILRSTAAPTYFPIYQGYVDGGTYANNPSLAAITTSIHYGIPLEDIIVLSLGTGFNPSGLTPQVYGDGNWGMWQWGTRIISMLLDANTEATTYQTQSLINERFHRLNPLLPYEIDLGDASAAPELKKIGDNYDLTATNVWLETIWGVNEAPIPDLVEESKGSYCTIQ